jgi:hypothetical protein
VAIQSIDLDAPTFARRGINLADPRLGATAVQTSDDFSVFATSPPPPPHEESRSPKTQSYAYPLF